MKNEENLNLHAQISSRLMENHRFGTSVTQKTEFIAAKGPAGEIDLFYTGPKKGGHDMVYNLQREDNSETGWRHNDLGNEFTPVSVTAGLEPGAQHPQMVFAQAMNDFNPDIYYTRELTPGEWDAWQLIDTTQSDIPQSSNVRAIKAEVIGGRLELFVILGNVPGEPFRPLTLWKAPWDDPSAQWQRLGEVDTPFIKYCKTAAYGEGLLIPAVSSEDPSAMDLKLLQPPYTGEPVTIAKKVSFTKLSVEEQKNGNSGIFLYGDNISFIDCSDKQPAPVTLPGTDNLTCRQILAVDAGGLPLTLYALTTGNILYCIKKDEETSQWDPPLPLGFQFSYIAGGINADKYPEIYGISSAAETENQLQCIWKSPPIPNEEMAPGWQKYTVDLPVQQMQVIPCYAVEISVFDENGTPQIDCDVEIGATEQIEVDVNGGQRILSARKLPFKTNSSGKIVLYSPATALNAPKLLLRFPGASNDDVQQKLDLNLHVADKIKNISQDDVKNLLPDKYKNKAKDIHDAVKQAMSAVVTGGNRKPVFLRPGLDSVYTPIDLSRVPAGSWMFSVENGEPRFKTLTPGEAGDLFTQMTAPAENSIIDDMLEWFTDAAESVAHGLSEGLTWVFTTTTEGIKTAISFFIDGIKYVFQGVLKYVEEAFQVAESIFHSVGVFFKELYEFFAALLDKYRKDIWATKDVFEKMINNSFEVVVNLLKEGQGKTTGFLKDMKTKMDGNFDTLLDKFGSQTFDYNSFMPAAVSAGNAGNGDILSVIEDMSAEANFLTQKVFSPLGSFTIDITIPEDIKQAFENFKTTADQSISQSFRDLVEQLDQFMADTAANPEKLFQLMIKTFLETAKTLLDASLDIAGAVLELFFDLLISLFNVIRDSVFNKPIKGFFLQEFYDLINPNTEKETLTLTRLLALLAAAPATLVYEAIFGEAPFGQGKTGRNAEEDDKTFHRIAGFMTILFITPLELAADKPVPEENGAKNGVGNEYLSGLLAAGITLQVFLFSAPRPTAVLIPASPFKPWEKPEDIGENLAWLSLAPVTAWSCLCGVLGVSDRGNPVTCIIMTLCGVLGLAAGIVAGILQFIGGGWNIPACFVSIAAPLPFVFKWLRFTGKWVLVLFGIDTVVFVGTGIAVMALNWPASDDQPKLNKIKGGNNVINIRQSDI